MQNLDLTVPGRMMNLPLFKAFDRKFRSLLALYCERHAFFPEHTATREGALKGISVEFKRTKRDFKGFKADFQGF